MTFWLILAAMTAAALAAIASPFVKRAHAERRGGDVAVYRDQLAEIERDKAAGRMPDEEAEASRIEVSRRLLKAAHDEEAQAAAPDAARARGLRGAVLAFSILATPLLAAGLYHRLGAPWEARPKAAAETPEAKGDGPSLAEMIARVEEHAQANPTDGRAFEVLAPVYMRIGRFDDAVGAWRKAIDLLGDTAIREAGLGEAIVGAADGIVSKEAKETFDRALALDANSVPARYYLALAAMQDGRREDARRMWNDMLAGATPDAAWTAPVRRALAELDRDAPASSGPKDQPAQAAPGPTGDDVAAAAKMTGAQREDMVRSMVARLADKLKQDGGDPEGWVRLVRAYAVLGQKDKAAQAVADARKALGADADKLARFEGALKEAP